MTVELLAYYNWFSNIFMSRTLKLICNKPWPPHLIRFLSQGPLTEKIVVRYDLVENSITVCTVGGKIIVERVKPLIRTPWSLLKDSF